MSLCIIYYTHVTSKQQRCPDVAFIIPMSHQSNKDVLMQHLSYPCYIKTTKMSWCSIYHTYVKNNKDVLMQHLSYPCYIKTTKMSLCSIYHTHVTLKQQRCPDVAFIIPMLHQNNKDVLMQHLSYTCYIKTTKMP